MPICREYYITLVGLNHRFGSDFIQQDMPICLVKEPDNEYDHEAIRAELPGLGTIGYVANSVSTVKGESMSAGRLYDHIGDTACVSVLYKLDDCVICSLFPEDIIVPFPEEQER